MPFSITFSCILLRSLIHTNTVTACICVQISWVNIGSRNTALVKEYMQVFLLNLNQLHSCHNPQIPWHISSIDPTWFSLCKSLRAKYICLHLALPKVSNLLFHFNSTENIYHCNFQFFILTFHQSCPPCCISITFHLLGQAVTVWFPQRSSHSEHSTRNTLEIIDLSDLKCLNYITSRLLVRR